MQGDAFIYGRLAALILALSLAVGCGAGKGVRADPVSPNSPLPSAATATVTTSHHDVTYRRVPRGVGGWACSDALRTLT